MALFALFVVAAVVVAVHGGARPFPRFHVKAQVAEFDVPVEDVPVREVVVARGDTLKVPCYPGPDGQLFHVWFKGEAKVRFSYGVLLSSKDKVCARGGMPRDRYVLMMTGTKWCRVAPNERFDGCCVAGGETTMHAVFESTLVHEFTLELANAQRRDAGLYACTGHPRKLLSVVRVHVV